jgi:N-dimethylarginine dimethylaminohydrolase
MCPPEHFDVEYVINPWMQGQVHVPDHDRAAAQWSQLRSLISESGEVVTLPPVAGLPDLVFTANAALIYGKVAVLSSFRCAERQPEAPHNADWLRTYGFDVHILPPGVLFEGAGDALVDRSRPLLWFGHGFRSDISALPYLKQSTGLEVEPLHLRDPRFYHLDTCFCPLEGGCLLYFPGAFDNQGNARIEARFPADKRYAVAEEDAVRFTCNAVNIGEKVIFNDASAQTVSWLTSQGFQVEKASLTEFMRSGGAAKCLSLRLNEG